ncbi:MAG: cytochrome c [Chloroflexi bacterium]|nr:cytochrome c [Chloroflexota bacterium]
MNPNVIDPTSCDQFTGSDCPQLPAAVAIDRNKCRELGDPSRGTGDPGALYGERTGPHKEERTRILTLATALALTLALGAPALAGGWAATTLDTLPPEFRAQETYSIGHTIRQHGVTPVSVEKMTDGWPSGTTGILITSPDGATTLRYRGVPTGATGHYVAQVKVLPFAAAAQDGKSQAAPAQPAGPNALPVSALLLATAGGAILFGTRAAAAAPAVALDPAVERGEMLFMAKGCVACHAAGGILDLANIAATGATRKAGMSAADHVRESLRTPDAFFAPGRPSADPIRMPQLGLSDEEVESLVAYLLRRT